MSILIDWKKLPATFGLGDGFMLKNTTIFTFIIFLFLITNIACSFAITVVEVDTTNAEADVQITDNLDGVQLYKWDDQKVYTSKGVFVTYGIQVTNKTSFTREQVARLDPPLVVDIVEQDGKVVEIIIGND